jgi:fructose-1-phosphate kinase PfkB-like protein
MFLCIGTTPTVQQTMVFPRVTVDEVNRAVEVKRSASGKPVNVARTLHLLGDPATVCIPLGGDTGQFIKSELSAERINLDAVDTPHATRTCVTMIDRKAGTATELVEPHAPISAELANQLIAKLKSHLPNCRSIVLSGTLAAGAGDDFYADCCRRRSRWNLDHPGFSRRTLATRPPAASAGRQTQSPGTGQNTRTRNPRRCVITSRHR